jgi:hypothetical protein
MKRELFRTAAAVAVIGCVGTSAALADTVVLPDPTLGGLLTGLIGLVGPGQDQPATGPGSHTLSITDALASGSATVINQGEPFPSVSASAQAQVLAGGGPASFAAFAELTYDIEITGPTPDVLVDISGHAKASFSGSGNGGEATIAVNNVGLFGVEQPTASVPFDIKLTLPTDSTIPVRLNASAAAVLGEPGSVSASYYIDPYFSIDLSNADAGAYSILVSPGIGNAPATPESSTWAMMLLGFAGLVFVGFRQAKAGPAILAG